MNYFYQCNGCGLRFEKNIKMSESTKPQNCPSCSALSDRTLPKDINGCFEVSVSGPTPQNTGINSLDVHIDRVIGQSAEEGRKIHAARVENKKELLENNPGATGYDIKETENGSFTIMKPEEKQAREKALEINNYVMNSINKK